MVEELFDGGCLGEFDPAAVVDAEATCTRQWSEKRQRPSSCKGLTHISIMERAVAGGTRPAAMTSV